MNTQVPQRMSRGARLDFRQKWPARFDPSSRILCLVGLQIHFSPQGGSSCLIIRQGRPERAVAPGDGCLNMLVGVEFAYEAE